MIAHGGTSVELGEYSLSFESDFYVLGSEDTRKSLTHKLEELYLPSKPFPHCVNESIF